MRRGARAASTASALRRSWSRAFPTWATSRRCLTPEERRRAGPKNGAQATATIALDPGGAVSVHVASVPQGQGHRTVAAQIVADALGLEPKDIRVIADFDSARDAWSIASGNYSSRFAAAVGGACILRPSA